MPRKWIKITNREYLKRSVPITLEWIRGHCIADPVTACWNWQRAKIDGYAKQNVSGKPMRVSRIVLGIVTGLILKAKYACHRCDNPSCVNPDHLFWGSPKENIQDSIAKNRFGAGVNNHKSFLTVEDVWAIRRSKESQRQIGRKYNLWHQNVGAIRNRLTYKSVPEESVGGISL